MRTVTQADLPEEGIRIQTLGFIQFPSNVECHSITYCRMCTERMALFGLSTVRMVTSWPPI
jgi:hypothetical protein